MAGTKMRHSDQIRSAAIVAAAHIVGRWAERGKVEVRDDAVKQEVQMVAVVFQQVMDAIDPPKAPKPSKQENPSNIEKPQSGFGQKKKKVGYL